MIKSETGHVLTNGCKNVLLADVTCIAGALKEIGISKEEIIDAVNNGFMSDEELVGKTADILAEKMKVDENMVTELLKALIK